MLTVMTHGSAKADRYIEVKVKFMFLLFYYLIHNILSVFYGDWPIHITKAGSYLRQSPQQLAHIQRDSLMANFIIVWI